MKKYKEVKTKEDSNKRVKRSIVLMSILILIGLTIFIGTSYALFSIMVEGKKKVSLETEEFKVDMEDGEYIKVDALGTMSDEEGKMSKPYTFTVTKNAGTIGAYYSLYLTEESGELNTYYLKYELKGTDGSIKEGRVGTLDQFYWSKYLEAGGSVTYELRLWLDKNTPNSEQGKSYQSKIALKGSQIPTGGPVLSDNMIPVVYNEEKGKWVTTTDKDNNWYNYDKQEWANAITVRENVREEYKAGGKEFDADSDDILQMFVWIPRYSYTIKSEDGVNYYGKKEEGRSDNPSQALPGEIDVKFISTSTKDEGSAQYTGYVPTGWYTPPGFTFGDKELPGIWVGKFETGYLGATTTEEAEHDTEEPNKVIIKPNVYSWRGIRVSTLEIVSMGITKVGNIYGFDQSAYDSHASKNTEWVLPVYLSQSKYGKYGNPLYTDANREIYKNTYREGVSGCTDGNTSGVGINTCTYKYNDLTIVSEGQGYAGAGASTSGNVTGIYDMNGGLWDYVMGNYVLDGIKVVGRSGYVISDTQDIEKRYQADKYYDFYISADDMTACNGNPCKGHGTYEVINWYSDKYETISEGYPWLVRGGSPWDFQRTGLFEVMHDTGNDFRSGANAFRVVLTPQ